MSTNKMKILIIEDDPELAMVLSSYLSKHGMEVTAVEDPYIGLSTLTQKDFDLVILDLTLPGMDGLEVVEKIREHSDIPIIISSARDDITDKVIGMERGADDYMPKPYDPRELVTRIKTILRRTGGQKKKEEALFELDKEGRVIRFKGVPLELTAAEFDVLSMLIQHMNAAVSREQLLYESEHIDDESSVKNIDVIISRIRKKIAKIDPNHTYIRPVRGVGYLLTDKPTDEE
ncbi:response regulator transcription factor [Nitratifractor salsuginis]|uniref:Two component transcriptional regulator, winged helix family n=1 Tax=Nitratifractor salsuginis (strain DSM 16511 / JCM 12458 / E9I37-1) TaxID=749222 RepID=E6WZE4_NITSE|nr:response regulator transcription factor [Nitratifractor salsuginis]ADV45524.1 two component transcriptional regulator, winged helix family [Nitratifractor salsuginis DSM 16511]